MQRTYQDIFPYQDFSHLTQTVEQYFSNDTPLWWLHFASSEEGQAEQGRSVSSSPPISQSPLPTSSIVGCLWVGNAVDQITGDRHAHVFLLYVIPEHRRRGLGKALMRYVENWARQRGDRQIGLQVFKSNTTALNLYNQLGYQTQSLWMIKSLFDS
ncbi:MAG: GNAT family N-acetyltransferase [Cyanomargarita calcarea GSE-NOS-MK-12-04C]|jgi:ribosomal protein S18 acetylase RimI-like enzyme|uniref:GNAT family N-acetyltransferase n=1 Tax=Cyanomargarita calcarea GSE-NOS-MK-12-04C TaxID=2839659 RepID=A0A951QSQ3_9CYAN|nr:GNAT family N-acetyltransferase [Cyanomargarita calcarea GSE-NOS-MK-12-04C]